MRYTATVVFCLMMVVATTAQETCSALVTSALEDLSTLCEAVGRNEICYGNNNVTVTPFGEMDLAFSSPGDIVPVTDIASIRTSPLSQPDEWGIALMSLQANLPDTLPGQNVTFLVYGDVELENATIETTTSSATPTNNLNIRNGPSTNFGALGTIATATEITLIARNEAGDWVYFQSDDEQSGWLYAPLLDITGDVMALEIVPDDFDGQLYAPMQVVYFQSGVGNADCIDAPESGILIQTPDFDNPIELIINDVQLDIGSTVYITAQSNGLMTVIVVEGEATVTANGESVTIPAGAFTTIELDSNLNPIGSPSAPQSYTTDNIENLPVDGLPESIEIAEPASQEDIAAANRSIEGTWNGIDVDGSNLTVTFTRVNDNIYDYTYTDDATTEAAGCDRGPISGSGQGELDGNVFRTNVSFDCQNTSTVLGPFDVTYTFDFSDGSMIEDWNGFGGGAFER